jgi:hypothetical protein
LENGEIIGNEENEQLLWATKLKNGDHAGAGYLTL